MHQVCQGIETLSPKVMKLMNKGFQDLGDIYQFTGRCIHAGIIPSFNIIFGYPGEGAKERRETINFMMDVCRRFPGTDFWTNIFTPYPGSPIFYRAQEIGIEVPKSVVGWGDHFPQYTVLPRLRGREHQQVQKLRDYLRIAFDRAPIAADSHSRFATTVKHLTRYPAHWWLDHYFYDFRFELWGNGMPKSIPSLPKPNVGAKPLEPETAPSCP